MDPHLVKVVSNFIIMYTAFVYCAYIPTAVQCLELTNPQNGMISCSLGDDGIPSYGDTCSFTCNTGYELTGSDTRTCQSDGSWSGTNTTCSGGTYV